MFEKKHQQEEVTTITARDGKVFEIPNSDPNYVKLCMYAHDVETRKTMKKNLNLSPDKEIAAYIKHKKLFPQETDVGLTEQERIALEAPPSHDGLGTGKSGEELAELIRKFHKPILGDE